MRDGLSHAVSRLPKTEASLERAIQNNRDIAAAYGGHDDYWHQHHLTRAEACEVELDQMRVGR